MESDRQQAFVSSSLDYKSIWSQLVLVIVHRRNYVQGVNFVLNYCSLFFCLSNLPISFRSFSLRNPCGCRSINEATLINIGKLITAILWWLIFYYRKTNLNKKGAYFMGYTVNPSWFHRTGSKPGNWPPRETFLSADEIIWLKHVDRWVVLRGLNSSLIWVILWGINYLNVLLKCHMLICIWNIQCGVMSLDV